MNKININKDWVQENYIEKNKSINDMVSEFGIAKNTLRRRIKEFGLTKSKEMMDLANSKSKTKFVFNKEELYDLYIVKNMSITDISEYYKVDRMTIYNSLMKCSIKKDKESALESYKNKKESNKTKINPEIKKEEVIAENSVISYEGYLTESKLGDVLKQVFYDCEIISQYKIPYKDSFFKVDYYIKELNMIVEYDGHRHYSDTINIARDINLKNHCEYRGITVVSIPYWVQLDLDTFCLIFGEYVKRKYIVGVKTFEVKFPHGFISENCVMPSNFVIFGWNRFLKEMNMIYNKAPKVYEDVIKSLKCKKDEIGSIRAIGDLEIKDSFKLTLDKIKNLL